MGDWLLLFTHPCTVRKAYAKPIISNPLKLLNNLPVQCIIKLAIVTLP